MNKRLSKAFLVCACLLLAGCNSKSDTGRSTQVIAKVNDEEITIHQFNWMLSQNKMDTQQIDETTKKQLVENLIEQSLIYQQALAAKLDRDPQVMITLEHAQRQVLAQAWLEKSAHAIPKPGQQQIDEYYQQHPELFARHKTYKLKELSIAGQADKQNQIQQYMAGSKQLDELQKKLDADQISYQISLATVPAENVPLEQLPIINSIKQGEFTSTNNGKGIIVLSVQNWTEDSIDKTSAQPVIENILLNLQGKQVVENTVKRLKEQAKIEWLGDFAKLNQQTVQAPYSLSVEKPAPKVDDTIKEAVISKGLKGL